MGFKKNAPGGCVSCGCGPTDPNFPCEGLSTLQCVWSWAGSDNATKNGLATAGSEEIIGQVGFTLHRLNPTQNTFVCDDFAVPEGYPRGAHRIFVGDHWEVDPAWPGTLKVRVWHACNGGVINVRLITAANSTNPNCQPYGNTDCQTSSINTLSGWGTPVTGQFFSKIPYHYRAQILFGTIGEGEYKYDRFDITW